MVSDFPMIISYSKGKRKRETVYRMPMFNFQDILVENQEKDRNCSVKNRAWDGWIQRKINTIQPYIEFLAKLKRTPVA